MNLKNYTTQVSAESSIAQIEKLLVKAGASGIMKQYENGLPSGLIFVLPIPGPAGKPPVNSTIKLPANVKECHQAMWNDHVKNRSHRSRKTEAEFRPQAIRTAWRIMLDWVEVQVSLIKLKQIEPLQAFLPYCYDGQRSVYERVKEQGFMALLPTVSDERRSV